MMRTTVEPSGPWRGVRRSLAAALLLTSRTLAAQLPVHGVELSASGGLHQFDKKTELASTVGFAGRLGYFIVGPLSLEGEISYARPHTDTPIRQRVNTTTFAGWLLLNQSIGTRHSLFIRGGYGSTSYGSCPAISVPGTGPCGSAGVLQGGVGARLGLTQALHMRYDITANRSLTTLKFSNLTFHAGLSVTLGGNRDDDADDDGVKDRADRCAGTARGTPVDGRGCTLDADRDGVADRLDRCPGTASGQPVDISGCPSDGDQDGVPDGVDQCNDTPRGATVDARGCSRDADGDGVADGLDRCPDTPAGARPDARGCPVDTDQDGVFDGLDRCSNTPAGARIDREGCPIVEKPRVDTLPPAPPVQPAPAKPAPAKPAPGQPAPPSTSERTWTVPGSVWTYRAAILDPEAFPILDSIATVLKADPEARAEVIGYAYDRLIPADDVRLSQYRAEAVRSYLTFKGVPVSRITAVGRGSRPLIDRGQSEAARARNRRVEIRITHPKK